jgi:hypothetical protein
MDDADGCLCGLTFELTPTAEVGRLARVVQHEPARHTGKLACRSGSGAERGVRPHRFGAALSEFSVFANSCSMRLTNFGVGLSLLQRCTDASAPRM